MNSLRELKYFGYIQTGLQHFHILITEAQSLELFRIPLFPSTPDYQALDPFVQWFSYPSLSFQPPFEFTTVTITN